MTYRIRNTTPTAAGGAIWRAAAAPAIARFSAHLCCALFAIAAAAPAPAQAPNGDAATSAPTAETPAAELERLQKAFTETIAKVTPCVVGIRTHRRLLSDFSADDQAAATAGVEQIVAVNGSGTIISASGQILTNEHVIQSAEEIEVIFHDGKSASAVVVAADPRSDLAVIKADRSGLTPAKFCDWSTVARGQWSIAVGNPFGLGSDGSLSVSTGVVSNLGRRLPGLGEVDDRLYNDMLQTTAAINPGNSGGPLFNIHGELLGVVTAMHTRAAADDGVGFAIPMTPARKRLIERLQAGRQIEYGYLGLTARTPEPLERKLAGLSDPIGAVVQDVEIDGPAHRAGVKSGDVVIAFNGRVIHGPGEFVAGVGETAIGATAKLELMRGRDRQTVELKVERRQVSRVAWMRGNAILWRGLRLTDLTPETRERMKVADDAGGLVVIDVARGSAADRLGIKIGDVVESVDDHPAGDVVQFRRIVQPIQKAARVKIRGGGEFELTP